MGKESGAHGQLVAQLGKSLKAVSQGRIPRQPLAPRALTAQIQAAALQLRPPAALSLPP